MFTQNINGQFMVASKTDLFEKELQRKACFFKALAHPARIQIIQYLARTKTCLSGDISDMFPISRTTVNQHMQELKNAGIINSREMDGKTVYCLQLSKIQEMHDILSVFLREINLPEDFCCECEKNAEQREASFGGSGKK
jgi:DNA-binding transcriptional ArsR family regulator